MFWRSLFWTTTFGELKAIVNAIESEGFSYNWFQVWTSKVIIGNISGLHWFSSSKIETYDTVRSDWKWFVSYNKDSKTIIVQWAIRANSKEELWYILDNMGWAFSEWNKRLEYSRHNWIRVKTLASVKSFEPDFRSSTVDYITFTIEVVILWALSYWLSQESISFVWQSSNFISSINNGVWNYKSEPVVSITFGSWISSVTSITIIIGWSIINVPWNFTDNDLVEIDSKVWSVSLNWVWFQLFTWEFGLLPIWQSDFEVSINWTRNADIFITWEPTYE